VTDGRLAVAVVGLEFGAEFVPIYQDHPAVRRVAVADLDDDRCARARARFDVGRSYASLDEALADDDLDAVHIVTGLDAHAGHVVAALGAGKHVACTVPMGLSFAELQAVVEAQRISGKTYMMMETAVFTRQFLWAEQLVRAGALGQICYARGTHFQDMTDWPPYWLGLPPMHYATHAIAPVLALLNARAVGVRAMGGGALDEANRGGYGPSFPLESALVALEGSAVLVELTRSLYQLARPYTESFSIYGDRQGIEWPQVEGDGDDMVLFEMGGPRPGRGRPVSATRVRVPDRADLLPGPVRRYTTRFVYGEEDGHRSFLQGGGHGGSHPHLVHEFVSSVVEGRPPLVGPATSANWTAVGIAAHQSALRGGAYVEVPVFA
jgi:predicted dehydrogenase